jgi:hypothetical protein
MQLINLFPEIKLPFDMPRSFIIQVTEKADVKAVKAHTRNTIKNKIFQ